MVSTSDVTYGQLDKTLRALGFSRRAFEKNGKGIRYEHKDTGALIILPVMPDEERVFDYHLSMVRTTLDGFGVADPSMFEKKLTKAG